MKIDTVKMVREIRDKMYEEYKHLSDAERIRKTKEQAKKFSQSRHKKAA
ncbi:MAG: hypothetical protein HZA78_00385 [Candidatus Schekmanbacteria bacterium]|nr:hypothetical protein [Candidatus Schekmanbacteria bacterium]